MIEDLANWFTARGWSPFPFQRDVWNAYLAGESGLVHAATGTGKTLAAWLGPIMRVMSSSDFRCGGVRATSPAETLGSRPDSTAPGLPDGRPVTPDPPGP